MRTTKFQNVLWGVAYKIGLDPAVELLDDQADALASYINEELRDQWDSADFPEWTKIQKVAVDSVTHTIPYEIAPIQVAPVTTETIGRVFNVYLIDPRTTDVPVDTPFKLRDDGIYVGLEHGPYVWVKYIAAAPQVTAKVWVADNNYAKSDLAYSAKTGECYKSKTNNNIGHDPTGTNAPPPALTTEVTQELEIVNTGSAAIDAIFDLQMLVVGGVVPLPDPPSSTAEFMVRIANEAGTLIGQATHDATGSESLATILADLVTQLQADPGLAGFTITGNAGTLTIRIQHSSNFSVFRWMYVPITPIKHWMQVTQIQAYAAAVTSTDVIRKAIQLTLTQDQVIPGATYQLTFIDLDSTEHVAQYTAQMSDNDSQIIQGLAAAVIAAAATDTFFTDIWAQAITETNLTFSSSRDISLTATVILPGSPWWAVVSFPFVLMNAVIDGAYASALKEEGQADKATGEEQGAAASVSAAAAKILAPNEDILTNQQAARSRYRIGQ